MMPGLPVDAPLPQIIKSRTSCRSYDGRPVEPAEKKRLADFIASLERPYFGSEARFAVMDLAPEEAGRLAGTYGVIKNAKTFLAGAVRQKAMAMVDFGFLFEKIILFATAIGLDTCWMGLTFNRTLFSARMALAPEETLPIVSPAGYRASRKSFTDMVFRMGAGSKNRKPWTDLFFNGSLDAPLTPEAGGDLALPLEMVRLGPSALNKQPWRLIRKKNSIHFFLQRAVALERMFQTDLQAIDMGIAMCHFELAAKEAGLAGFWVVENPDILNLPNNMEYIVTWMIE